MFTAPLHIFSGHLNQLESLLPVISTFKPQKPASTFIQAPNKSTKQNYFKAINIKQENQKKELY